MKKIDTETIKKINVEDTERLDWCEKNLSGVYTDMKEQSGLVTVAWFDINRNFFKEMNAETLRGAIDKAMEATNEK